MVYARFLLLALLCPSLALADYCPKIVNLETGEVFKARKSQLPCYESLEAALKDGFFNVKNDGKEILIKRLGDIETKEQTATQDKVHSTILWQMIELNSKPLP